VCFIRIAATIHNADASAHIHTHIRGRPPLPCQTAVAARAPAARLRVLCFTFSGAESPVFRHGVSAVSWVLWYTAHVLRHSRFGESERFALHLPNRTFRRCWQESLPA